MSYKLDLVGKTVDKLTITRFAFCKKRNGKNIYYWYADCKCGKKDHPVDSGSFNAGRVRSCGCIHMKHGALEDLVGKTITNLLITKYIPKKADGCNPRYEYKCLNCNYIGSKIRSEFTCKKRTVCFNCKGIPQFTDGFSTWYFTWLETEGKRRGLGFDLTHKFLAELFISQKGLCALSGRPINISLAWKNHSKQTASLDRIDSSRGYFKDNVQFIHKDFQFMKWTYNQDYFIKSCEEVVNFQKNKDRILNELINFGDGQYQARQI